MEWRPVGWSMCLLIFPCTITSRISLLEVIPEKCRKTVVVGGGSRKAVTRVQTLCNVDISQNSNGHISILREVQSHGWACW